MDKWTLLNSKNHISKISDVILLIWIILQFSTYCEPANIFLANSSNKDFLVDLTGLEPVTLRMWIVRSSQLS